MQAFVLTVLFKNIFLAGRKLSLFLHSQKFKGLE